VFPGPSGPSVPTVQLSTSLAAMRVYNLTILERVQTVSMEEMKHAIRRSSPQVLEVFTLGPPLNAGSIAQVNSLGEDMVRTRQRPASPALRCFAEKGFLERVRKVLGRTSVVVSLYHSSMSSPLLSFII
jgi:hypothetical protein